ncbi:nuclease-related domain-containing protein [Streptomyces sp. NBC_01716]|uniref:nuclease-related domain-containing protein n=1 Tax=Streptomyces sp. NBC_01716 TaxID=2975917 RepID=UPI002E3104AE|nr:nuclease-related domain-containing protein [Streptomyces sp. NBC_01716]
MTAGNSASARAAAMRAAARKGWWRRVLAWIGIGGRAARRTDARAALWSHGAAGEEQTARLLVELQARGWVVWHDLMLWGRRFNLDHILISPCGTVVVVLDTKAWRRTWTTGLVYGRVHCGPDDRHSQIEKVASYAQAVAAVAGLHPAVVRPLIVVHGSPVAGGFLEAMTPHGPVHVLSPGFLVPTLLKAPGVPDAWRARALAEQVERVLAPFAGRG